MTDPWFAGKVRSRWSEVRDAVATLPAYVESSADAIRTSAELTFSPDGANNPLTATLLEPTDRHVFHGSWAGEAAALSDWLEVRIAWLDAQWD